MDQNPPIPTAAGPNMVVSSAGVPEDIVVPPAAPPVAPTVGTAAPVQKQEKVETLAAREFNKKSASFKKERLIIKAREKELSLGKRASDLMIPFIAVGILMIIIFFVLIPFGTQTTETREQTKILMEETRKNRQKVEILSGINVAELDDKLNVVTTVVRDERDVSELAIEVEQLAVSNSLEPTSQSMSNSQDVVSESTVVDSDWVPSYATAISGPFAFKGAFDNIMHFLRDLRMNSETIMSLGKVTMSRSGTETGAGTDTWSVSLLISGYVAPPVTDVKISDPISTDVDQELLNELYRRAGVTDESDEGTDTLDEGQE